MQVTTAGDVLFGRTRQKVLGLLFTRPTEDFHLRQIVRLTGAGLGPVQRELQALVSAGLVMRQQRGRQVFFRADAASPVFEELRGLVVKTAGLADQLRAALAVVSERVRCAFVFGSFARGGQGRDSDVDVMVIGDAPFADVARALLDVQRRLAREVNPTVYPPAEFAEKLAAGHHFLRRVVDEPKIFLIGTADELARVAAERVGPAPSGQRG